MNTQRQLDYLKNGAAVITRRLHDADREKILSGFNALSPLSRYRRFLHNKNTLKKSEIDCLFATPDKWGASYIVMECNNTQTQEEGRCIGLIQLIAFESDRSCAEVALVVIDEFHNCGLGKLLINTIEKEAANRQIQHLYFYSTSDNKALMAILNRAARDISVDREFGSVTLIMKVTQDLEPETDREFVNSVIPATVVQSKLIHQGQLLSTTWFRVCLRMMIYLNQVNLLLCKSR